MRNLGEAFDRSFGGFLARRRFTMVPGSYYDDPRGYGKTLANGDFQMRVFFEPPYKGGPVTHSVDVCPPSGPDNLGWIPARRVISHVTNSFEPRDLDSIASALDAHYDLLKVFFHEDDEYSDRWHLVQAYGNPKRVFVAPRWSDRPRETDERSE
jgi:hypothetical protein